MISEALANAIIIKRWNDLHCLAPLLCTSWLSTDVFLFPVQLFIPYCKKSQPPLSWSILLCHFLSFKAMKSKIELSANLLNSSKILGVSYQIYQISCKNNELSLSLRGVVMSLKLFRYVIAMLLNIQQNDSFFRVVHHCKYRINHFAISILLSLFVEFWNGLWNVLKTWCSINLKVLSLISSYQNWECLLWFSMIEGGLPVQSKAHACGIKMCICFISAIFSMNAEKNFEIFENESYDRTYIRNISPIFASGTSDHWLYKRWRGIHSTLVGLPLQVPCPYIYLPLHCLQVHYSKLCTKFLRCGHCRKMITTQIETQVLCSNYSWSSFQRH